MIDFENANKTQLLQIALDENCSLDDKYQACVELQLKRWDGAFLYKLVKYWGNGMSEIEVADKLGVEVWEVHDKLRDYGLFRKRVKGNGIREVV